MEGRNLEGGVEGGGDRGVGSSCAIGVGAFLVRLPCTPMYQPSRIPCGPKAPNPLRPPPPLKIYIWGGLRTLPATGTITTQPIYHIVQPNGQVMSFPCLRAFAAPPQRLPLLPLPLLPAHCHCRGGGLTNCYCFYPHPPPPASMKFLPCVFWPL